MFKKSEGYLMKNPWAHTELVLPICTSQEPWPLIEAGKLWKPPFRLEQYNCDGID